MCGRIAWCDRGRSFRFLPKGIKWVAGTKAHFYGRCNSGERAWKNQPPRPRTPFRDGPREIGIAMIGFLNKAFISHLLVKNLEDNYAEIIGRTEIRSFRRSFESGRRRSS